MTAEELRPGAPFVLAIDIGSSSVRAMVFDRSANAVDGLVSQISYELDVTADGGVTMDAQSLLELVERCVDTVLELASDRCELAAVGISSFWHSLLGLDEAGDPLTPILHLADSRSADVVDELRRTQDEAAYKATGGTVFHSSYWPAKLIWLRQIEPETFSQVEQWTSGADFVMRRLTGATSTSVCMASGTGMLDITHCTWSAEIADLAGVDIDELPPLVDRHEGTQLRPAYANRWTALSAIPWFPPLGDGACANVGSGAVYPDSIAMTLGTTGAVRVLQASEVGTTVEPADGLWTYRLDRHTVIRGAAITNGGIMAEFLLEMLGASGIEMFDAAFELSPAEHGLTVLPFLAGERAPIWNDRARAVIAGLNPRTTQAEIMRAGLESVGHRMRLIYDLLRPNVAQEHKVLANGAALLKSPGWQQILASSLGHPIVTLPAELEASARGAAICALESLGFIESLGGAEDLSVNATVVAPQNEEAQRYVTERDRQLRLQELLYPLGSSWDT